MSSTWPTTASEGNLRVSVETRLIGAPALRHNLLQEMEEGHAVVSDIRRNEAGKGAVRSSASQFASLANPAGPAVVSEKYIWHSGGDKTLLHRREIKFLPRTVDVQASEICHCVEFTRNSD